MDKKHSRSKSSDYSCDSKTDTYPLSSQSKTKDHSKKSCYDDSYRSDRSYYSDYSDYDRSNYSDRDRSYSNCDKKKRCDRKSSYSYDCGLKYSKTPIGVWNMVYSCDNACTTTGTMEWLNQLLLNGDETVTSFSAPDVGHNPFPCSLTPGVGIWKNRDKKLKLELTHIGYRCSDGAAQAYYKVYITMKMNNKGTRARFRGEACPFDISDPTLCTPADHPSLCFSGCAVKVLEPNC